MPKRPLPSSLAASKTRVRFHQPVRFTSKPDRVIEFNVHRRETDAAAAAPEVATAPKADEDAPERRLSRTLSPVNMGGRPRRHSISADEASIPQPGGDDDGMSRWGDDEEDVIEEEDGSWRSRASEEDRGDEEGAVVRSLSAPPCTQADAARDHRRGHHLPPEGVTSPASAQTGRGAAASVSAPAAAHSSQFPPPLPSYRSTAPAASAAGPHPDSRRSASVPPRIASLERESGGGARTAGGGAGSDRESGTGFLTDFVMDSATVAPFARPGPWPHGSLPQRARSPPLAVGLPPSLLMQRQQHSPRSTASVISHGSLWVGGAPPPLLDGGVGIALHLGSRSSSIASLGWGGTDGGVSQHLVLPELPRVGSSFGDSAPPVAAALPARRRSGSASMYGSFSLHTPSAAIASPSAADAGSHPLSQLRGVQLPIIAREMGDPGSGLRLWAAAPPRAGNPRKSSDALDLLAAASESEPALTSSSEEDGGDTNGEGQGAGKPSTDATSVPGAALRSNKRLRRDGDPASSASLRVASGTLRVVDAAACGGADASTGSATELPPLLAGAAPTSRRDREKPKRPRGRPKKRLRGAAAMRRSEAPPEGGAGDVSTRPPAAAAAAVDGMAVVATAELLRCEAPAEASAAALSRGDGRGLRGDASAGIPPAIARAVLELQLRSLQGQADWLRALESLARSEPLAVVRAVQEASAALRAAAAALGSPPDSAVPPLISRIVERLRLGEEASPVSLLLRQEGQASGGGPQALALELLTHAPPSRL